MIKKIKKKKFKKHKEELYYVAPLTKVLSMSVSSLKF